MTMRDPWDLAGWQEIESLLRDTEKAKSEIAVIMVANVKGRTAPARDYDGDSISTEFFSEAELDEITIALREFGFYVQTFFNEDAFLKWVIDGKMEHLKKKYRVVYNTAQGTTGPGKKALIPAFCGLHNIAVTTSDPYVVGLARHKYHVNCILRYLGLSAPKSWLYRPDCGWLQAQLPRKGERVILKLTYEAASMGLGRDSVVTTDGDLEGQVAQLSRQYSQPITVQQFIEGYEAEVPVIQLTSPFAPQVVGLSARGKKYLGETILTYEDVYDDNYSFYPFNEISEAVHQNIIRCASQVFQVLGVRGFGRADFRITSDGDFYVVDVATSPHITQHSSFSFNFTQKGLPYSSLLATLVGLTCKRMGWI